jgi:hypothetical protein
MITPGKAKRILERRASIKPKTIDLDPNFAAQNAFINDPSKHLVAQCSRRAGKTNGIAIRFLQTMAKYPKSQCLYIALTMDSARDIMWGVLHEFNDKFNLGLTFTESKLTVTGPNGAKLRLVGADMKDFIKRLKGRKYPGVAIDEAQDFGSHLQKLVEEVIEPSISDYVDGWIAITGTPGPVPTGYFFEITEKRKYGYSFHAWTSLENPYMPNPEAFIEQIKKDREWDETNPTLQREYRNRWVLDRKSLWIQYEPDKSHYENLPELPNKAKWNYILGVDIGFNDADALALIAWSEHSPKTYLVDELINRKQGITELAEQIKAVMKVYDPHIIVMDSGALGKKVEEELSKRFGIPVKAAEKERKQENVEFLNDDLRRGLFMAKKDSQFAKDSYQVQIDWDKSTPNKIVIKKKPHSDIIDAVLYGYKAGYAYTHVPTKPTLTPGTPEWSKQQQEDMWESAVEHFREQAESSGRYGNYDD